MVRGPCTFRERDVTRAIRAVEAAGKKARKVEVDYQERKVIIVIAQDDDDAAVERNEWDAE
jgi:hypothetical protein